MAFLKAPEQPTFGSKPSSRAKLRRSSISILRPILDERHFEENYQSVERKIKFSVPEPIRSAISPPKSLHEWKQFVFLHIPILTWILSYKKGYILSDIIAGVTIGIMQVAQGLAYALLAEMPPVYGLYTSFVPPLIYTIFGASRQLSFGCFTLVCLLVGSGINRVISGSPEFTARCDSATLANATMNATASGLNDCDQLKVELALLIAFTAGVIMIICSVFQLGFITMFFSDALISGYTTAAGFHAVASQLKYVFDFNAKDPSVATAVFEVPETIISTVKLIYFHHTNWTSFLITAVSFTFLVIVRLVNKKLLPRFKLYKRFPIPIPGAVILVVTATLISRFAQFETTFNVTVVGFIPATPPPLVVPKFEHFSLVFQDAFLVAIISFAIGVSLSKMFAKKNKYPVSANQELFAYGMANFIGCFFSAFSSSASLSRTTVADNTGAKTQVVSLISSALVLLTLLALGPILKDLPLSVLAATVLEALISLFMQFKDIRKYYKLSKPDLMVWFVSFGATVLLGIDIGLGIAVAFSLFMIIGRIVLPPSASLGRAPNTEIFRNRKDFKKVQSLPGILIFRFVAPLCYVNALVFRTRLVTAAGVDPAVALRDDNESCFKIGCKKIKHKASNVTFKRHYSSSTPSAPGAQEGLHLTPPDARLSGTGSPGEQGDGPNRPSTPFPQDHRGSGAAGQLRPLLRNSESDLTPILKNRNRMSSTGTDEEGSGSFSKLSDALKKKWHRFVGTPTPLSYEKLSNERFPNERFSNSSREEASEDGVDIETAHSSAGERSQVRIVINPAENVASSVGSAVLEVSSDESPLSITTTATTATATPAAYTRRSSNHTLNEEDEDEDEEEDDDDKGEARITERHPAVNLPKRKRTSDSVDSGEQSDTESHPSSLHLAELDEEEQEQSGQGKAAPAAKQDHFAVVSCVSDDAELPIQPNLHTVIIDCAPITFMDSSGAEVLEQIIFDYDKIGIQILLARAAKPNRDMLTRSGFFERFGKEWLFPSLQDAVNHAETGVRLRRYVHNVNAKISIEYSNMKTKARHLRRRKSSEPDAESGSRGSSGDEDVSETDTVLSPYWATRKPKFQIGEFETDSIPEEDENDSTSSLLEKFSPL